jgi:hypothetical protein
MITDANGARRPLPQPALIRPVDRNTPRKNLAIVRRLSPEQAKAPGAPPPRLTKPTGTKPKLGHGGSAITIPLTALTSQNVKAVENIKFAVLAFNVPRDRKYLKKQIEQNSLSVVDDVERAWGLQKAARSPAADRLPSWARQGEFSRRGRIASGMAGARPDPGTATDTRLADIVAAPFAKTEPSAGRAASHHPGLIAAWGHVLPGRIDRAPYLQTRAGHLRALPSRQRGALERPAFGPDANGSTVPLDGSTTPPQCLRRDRPARAASANAVYRDPLSNTPDFTDKRVPAMTAILLDRRGGLIPPGFTVALRDATNVRDAIIAGGGVGLGLCGRWFRHKPKPLGGGQSPANANLTDDPRAGTGPANDTATRPSLRSRLTKAIAEDLVSPIRRHRKRAVPEDLAGLLFDGAGETGTFVADAAATLGIAPLLLAKRQRDLAEHDSRHPGHPHVRTKKSPPGGGAFRQSAVESQGGPFAAAWGGCPPPPTIIQVPLYLDGRLVAEAVTSRQAIEAYRAPASINTVDGRSILLSPHSPVPW